MIVAILLGVAALCLAAGTAFGMWRAKIWLGCTLAGCAAGLAAAVAVLAGYPAWEWRGGIAIGGEMIHLRLDAVSALFLALVSVVGAAGAVYGTEYWSEQHHPDSAPRGRCWWNSLVAGMAAVLLCANGLHFLIAWEIFALSAYFLITLDRDRGEVRDAGWLYLAASHAGTLCLFAFFGLLAARTGSWDLGPVLARRDLAPLYWLALFGFGVKAGMFPMHIWLPAAHANSPSHVSAILSGVAIKMGLYGILRFGGWMTVPVSAGWVILGLGITSALLGATFALVQNDLKRLLAYCSVENMGVMLTGLGAAQLATAHGGAAWGRLVLAGALLHIWNHGVFKSLLFFGAGSVLHASGTREISRMGGLWKSLPWTASLFALGAMAVSGLPPLNGFVSEWMVYLGLFESATGHSGLAWATMPAAILLAATGALVLVGFIKASAMVFLGAPRGNATDAHRDCGMRMRGPMLVLACVCVVIGLMPVLVWPALSRVIAAWHPAWASQQAPAPLSALAAAHVGLAALATGAAFLLWNRSRRNGLRRAPTWDCGYAMPTARMQYTGGSFADTVAGGFRWILHPVRAVKRPHGLLPGEARWMERFPETVLERVLMPVGGWVMKLSSAVRGLQQGRLHAYIFYLVAGLAALGILVILGGAP